MPVTEVRAYREAHGSVPLLAWLESLQTSQPKAFRKCLARIEELSEKGNRMRRPHADYLRDGIYELRATLGTMQYRILYFFFGKGAVVLSHGITKEKAVPPGEIDKAIQRKVLVKSNPDTFTATFEVEEIEGDQEEGGENNG